MSWWNRVLKGGSEGSREVAPYPLAIAAAELRVADGRYRDLYDGTPVMLQSLDDQLRLVSVNRHWLEVMGYELSDVLGRDLMDFLASESAERARTEVIPRLRETGEVGSLELQFVTRSGRVLDVQLSARAHIRNGRLAWSMAFVVDVTEKKRAAEALRRSEAHFRHLFDSLADGVFLMDSDGMVLEVNQHACRDLGRSRDDLVGHPAWEFSTTPPEQIREVLREASAGDPVMLQTEYVRSDGKTFPVEVRAAVLEEGATRLLVGLARDMTARSRAEAALRESEERFAGIFHSAMDAIILFNADMVVALFNRAAEEVFRCPAADVVGTALDRFLSPELGRKLRDCIACLGDGSDPHLLLPASRFQAVRCDGEAFPVEATVSAVYTAGQTLYCIILRDVHQLARAEAVVDALLEEKAYLEQELRTSTGAGDIIGRSAALRRVLRQVERVATTDTTVLITGETGTGKELIATAIHGASSRAGRRLVKVNCAALAPTLVESELFGHERGAFTGATARKIGRFERADRGTLFLDEIGELTPQVQVKLLRVLQEGEFERVGGADTLCPDVRLIAATNRNLDGAVRDGRFRADLFYRLNVFPIHLPPLRERREDIPDIVRHLTRKHAARMGRPVERIDSAALDWLLTYDWPGNIRELENVIERGLVLSDGPVLRIPEILGRNGPGPGRGRPLTLDEAQRRHILSVLQLTGWRVSGEHGAARILGMKPTTLESRMKKLRIERPRPTTPSPRA